jgi:hypothetical protein
MGEEIKKWLVVIVAAIAFVLFMWFGWRLLTAPAAATATQMFILGCLASLGGLVIFGVPSKFRFWGLALFLVGVYYFARASGTFTSAWLIRVLGIASLVAAAMVGYLTWKFTQAKPDLDSDSNSALELR